jgi:hypothetical protein
MSLASLSSYERLFDKVGPVFFLVLGLGVAAATVALGFA